MTIEAFDHLSAFGVAGAQVPARKAARLLATEVQLELVDGMLAEAELVATSLRALREPDTGRINYLDAVRSEVARKWQPLVDNLANTPPTRLLGDLDAAWKAAEGKIAGDAQQHVGAAFSERATAKVAVVQEEAGRVAAEGGLRTTLQWIEALKEQCDQARGLTANDLSKLSDQRKRQLKEIARLKEDWTKLLSQDDADVSGMARRFLFLAGAVLALGYVLWLLAIPVNSVGGMAAIVVTLLLALQTARPLFRRLRFSRRSTVTASNLMAAYRASSLLGLDEMAKRQEVDYASTLRDRLDGLLDRCRQRVAELQRQRAALREENKALADGLFQAPPTIRVILSGETLEEWRQRGRAQIAMVEWRRRLALVTEPVDWSAIEQEARGAFAFVLDARVEDEILRLHPASETRMGFLLTLRDAAIGTTPGEAFLSLDLGVTGGRPPQTFLLVEVDDPSASPLAQEIESAWAGSGVGVTLLHGSDPTMLTLVGFVYGYRLDAQRDWPSIEAAFDHVRQLEGLSIFPVLFPSQTDGTAATSMPPAPIAAQRPRRAARRVSGNGAQAAASPDPEGVET